MASVVQGEYAPGRSESTPRPGVLSLTDSLLLLMALIWGVNYSVVKYATRVFDPIAFNGLRVFIATAILGTVALGLPRAAKPSRRDALRLVGLGVIGHGIYQIGFVEGIARTTAGTAALVMAASPALIGVVGRALGVERLTRRAWGGIGLQLLGMLSVVVGSTRGAPAAHDAGASPLLGTLILLGASVAWAFYAVLLKPYAERVHPTHLSALTLVGGVATLGLLAIPGLARTDWGAVAPMTYGAVAYSGIAAMVIAYLFYYRGVRVLGPTRTAMYSNLQPIIALVVAYLTLGEAPAPAQLIGATLIMLGLLVSRR